MATYVFAIGGTGARVLRSATMLAAAGVDFGTDLIPIIIDMDAHNGDTRRSLQALDRYRIIRGATHGVQANLAASFFKTNIRTLATAKMTEGGANAAVADSFAQSFTGIDTTFADYINFNRLDGLDRDFLTALYDDASENEPRTELHLRLSVGFKGNPNIGSVLFTGLKNESFFQALEAVYTANDRIFIISSIFGGTGSSGFPQLVELIRSSTKNTNLQTAKIGAVTVMPYFSLQNNDASAINSNQFISKTKAALSYYKDRMARNSYNGTQQGVDKLYYLYDKPGTPYANNEGGARQQNDAHPIEVIAASAMQHFCQQASNTFGNATTYFEYAANDVATKQAGRDNDLLDTTHFFAASQRAIMLPMTKFAFYSKLFVEFLPQQNSKEPYMPDFAALLNDSAWRGFSEEYRNWLVELKRNRRGLQPFGFAANDTFDEFNSLVVHKPYKTGWIDKGMSQDKINSVTGKRYDALKGSTTDVYCRLLTVLNATCDELFATYVTELPKVG